MEILPPLLGAALKHDFQIPGFGSGSGIESDVLRVPISASIVAQHIVAPLGALGGAQVYFSDGASRIVVERKILVGGFGPHCPDGESQHGQYTQG